MTPLQDTECMLLTSGVKAMDETGFELDREDYSYMAGPSHTAFGSCQLHVCGRAKLRVETLCRLCRTGGERT